jgi:hypothetical protein
MLLPIRATLHRLVVASCAFQVATLSFAQDKAPQLALEPAGLIEYAAEPLILSAQPVSGSSRKTAADSQGLRATFGTYALPVGLQENVGAQADSFSPPIGSEQARDATASPSDVQMEEVPTQEKSLAPLQIGDLSMDVTPVDISMKGIGTGVLPTPAWSVSDQPILLPDGYARGATAKSKTWQASWIEHYPLRYEDAMLERHGHVRFGCLQPLASGVKFISTIPLTPYLCTLKPRRQPIYALGNWRAGSRAPLLKDHLPWDRKAAVVEALTVAGFFWAAPL